MHQRQGLETITGRSHDDTIHERLLILYMGWGDIEIGCSVFFEVVTSILEIVGFRNEAVSTVQSTGPGACTSPCIKKLIIWECVVYVGARCT